MNSMARRSNTAFASVRSYGFESTISAFGNVDSVTAASNRPAWPRTSGVADSLLPNTTSVT